MKVLYTFLMDIVVKAPRKTPTGVAALLAIVTALAVVGGCAAQAAPGADEPPTASGSAQALPSATPTTSPAAAVPSPPGAVKNVVLLLADDLDTRGFRQIPRLRQLQDEGLTLRNMVVTDSLCCPSRTSILRSQYVHNHQVISNLQVSVENQSAARGRIMDADFAQETANMSRAQILQQAGTAMVAQANQLPQQVLSLLGR